MIPRTTKRATAHVKYFRKTVCRMSQDYRTADAVCVVRATEIALCRLRGWLLSRFTPTWCPGAQAQS